MLVLSGRYNGKVLQVIDGDTIWVKLEGVRTRVRLAYIDAPEKNQHWARQSKEALEKWLLGKECIVTPVAWDRYARVVATLIVDKIDPAVLMLLHGHAVIYRQQGAPIEYRIAEQTAREKKRGVFSCRIIETPEQFRARSGPPKPQARKS